MEEYTENLYGIHLNGQDNHYMDKTMIYQHIIRLSGCIDMNMSPIQYD